MCDTICSLLENNNERASIFGKNSDRDPNEIQVVEFHERTVRDGGVQATYIKVDFEGETNAIVISRPLWMWGAEIGVNEKGVAIGNEAIFSRPVNSARSLLGMDLLRLGLEKGNDAISSAETIIDYLQKYGQGGSNDKNGKEYYNNLFLISDFSQVLELSIIGKEYLLKRVKGFDSVSNISPAYRESEKIELKRSQNYSCKEDFLYSRLGRGIYRSSFTSKALEESKGKNDVRDVFNILRHHDGDWSRPIEGSNNDICMHAGPVSRRFQTTNSLVAELGKDRSVLWSTFSSNPCISLYKPIFFDRENVFGLGYDSSYWLDAEKIHRGYLNSSVYPAYHGNGPVEERQGKIISLTKEIREAWLFSEPVEESLVRKVLEEVKQLDREHLTNMKTSLEKSKSAYGIGFYNSWWRKKNSSLDGLSLT